MSYDNTNTGVLFKNKEKDEAHPNWADYQGNINVNGVEFWLSAWLKTSKKTGEKFMSLSTKPKEARQPKDHYDNYTDAMPGNDDLNSDIPF